LSGTNTDDMASKGMHESNILQTRVRNGFLQSSDHSNKIFEEDEIYENTDKISTLEELRASYLIERRRCKELENLVSRLKGEDVAGLDVTALEELQNLHVEAITKICHAKCTNHDLWHPEMNL